VHGVSRRSKSVPYPCSLCNPWLIFYRNNSVYLRVIRVSVVNHIHISRCFNFILLIIMNFHTFGGTNKRQNRKMADEKRKFNLRSFTSFTLVISTLIMSWSGFILYIAPPGRIANWGTWKLMLFTKSEWQALHTIFSYLFSYWLSSICSL
jgi:hypothetical protein